MLDLLRYTVFALFVASAVIAVGSWAVTTRRLNPFGTTAQLIRRVSDPVLVPLERWLLRRGGNPQNAPWWLLGLAIAGGIVVITTAEFALRILAGLIASTRGGPRGVIRALVYLAGQLVSLALIVRVIGSWFGVGRFNRWMRPAYRLTDWIVEPLRRVIPPIGMIDVTPIVAWALVQFLIVPALLVVL